MPELDAIERALEAGDAAVGAGRLAEAEEHFQSAVNIADAEQDARIIRALHGLGYVTERLGRYPDAERAFHRSVVIAQAALGQEHQLTARGLNHLALVMRLQGRAAEARPLADASLRIAQTVEAGSDAAAAENTLALIAIDMGNGAEGLQRLKRVVSMTEGFRGERHPDVAAALGNLGDLYRRMDREADALPVLQRAFSIMQEVVGPEGFELATPLNNLALCHDSMGDFVLAEPLFKRAIGIWENHLEPTNPLLLGGHLNLANLFRKMGRYDESEPMFVAVIAGLEQSVGPTHPFIAIACDGLADLLKWTDREEEAQQLIDRAQAIRAMMRG